MRPIFAFKTFSAFYALLALSTLGVVETASAQAVAPLSQEAARRAIAPFYDMLNKPASKDLTALSAAMAPEWRSYSADTVSKGRDEFVAQVSGFGKLIPDLAWDIRDVMVDGNKVIVRSEASGTPVGPFFGVPAGGKSFKIMTIDIHTVQNGKLVAAHHVEDWASALRQLAAK